jgi:hypothetical protein
MEAIDKRADSYLTSLLSKVLSGDFEDLTV